MSSAGLQPNSGVILSFDLERWYDATLAHSFVPHGYHDESLIAQSDRLLEYLDELGTRATFFVLGEVAKAFPTVIHTIAQAGHEIACHGQTHTLLGALNAAGFEEQLRIAKDRLQSVSGQPVVGFRAPSWSMASNTAWAFDVLVRLGFLYDSSIFPMRTGLYGISHAPKNPYWLALPEQKILELPPAVGSLCGLPVPLSGGIYWRLLPPKLVVAGLKRGPQVQMTYAHPWELGPLDAASLRLVPLVRRLTLTVGHHRPWRVLRALADGRTLMAHEALQACADAPTKTLREVLQP